MILLPQPFNRVNDKWVHDDSIDASPIYFDVAHPLVTTPPNTTIDQYQTQFYKKIAVDIVTESVLAYPYPYITEKVLRPFACKRMFVYVGPHGVLKMLQDKGFETFGDIIDESYDNIEDPVKRFKKIVEVVNDVVGMPLATLKNYFKKNQGKFERNLQVLSNIEHVDYCAACDKLGIGYD